MEDTRAVIYTRKSSDPKATLRSVEEQDSECRRQADREGWQVVRTFTDNDRSASRHSRRERPAYQELQEFLRDGGADVLLLWEGSRAQRDLRDYLRLRDLCAEQGVRYSYSGRVYDLSRTDDRFTTALDALLAEREADVTRDRVLRAMRGNAGKGRPHGKVLYGYERRYDGRGVFVEQVEHAEQATVVREVASRVARGEPPHAVAMDLNRRGIPSPGGAAWDITAVRRLVVNPAYAGHRVFRRQIVGTAVWPAILDQQAWQRCVARLGDPGRKQTRDVSLRWLLSGIARCAVCGAPLRVSRGGSEDAAHYVCSKRSCVSVRGRGLDTFAGLVVVERLRQPDVAAALSPPGDAGAAALAEARELRERLSEYVHLAAAGKLTAATLVAVEAELLPKIQDAERRGRQAAGSPVLAEVAGPDAGRIWDGLPVAVRREVVTLLAEVRVRPAGKGARYLDRDLAEEDPELARIDPARVEIDWRRP